MALPSSGPLSLNDIRVELQQAQANSSLDALSNLAGFTNPDAVSDFYGYSYATYNTFAINTTSYGEYIDACALDASDNKTLYFAGSGGTAACPAQGVTLYTTSALTTAYNGGGFWWRSKQCNAAYNILSDGFIEAIEAC